MYSMACIQGIPHAVGPVGPSLLEDRSTSHAAAARSTRSAGGGRRMVSDCRMPASASLPAWCQRPPRCPRLSPIPASFQLCQVSNSYQLSISFHNASDHNLDHSPLATAQFTASLESNPKLYKSIGLDVGGRPNALGLAPLRLGRTTVHQFRRNSMVQPLFGHAISILQQSQSQSEQN